MGLVRKHTILTAVGAIGCRGRKQKIVEDPLLWRTGFAIEAIRLAVRDFADGDGDTILKAAVSIWKK